ncbi:hypothetical protein RJ639_026226 [Escallonia herrerae]|uniref:Trichome birefringence-like C-terminal domain-containing protein n=1 Tax=Escallonia herrerae TaxID=1293975 RepID=A0AA88UW00_9ASTE|nr:hypothetical protein RJ639_026226 [Escallonia herrerae]
MSSRRKDGHASVYYLGSKSGPASLHRQDCSHWCLPGVPDSWNELLYALFLRRRHAWAVKEGGIALGGSLARIHGLFHPKKHMIAKICVSVEQKDEKTNVDFHLFNHLLSRNKKLTVASPPPFSDPPDSRGDITLLGSTFMECRCGIIKIQQLIPALLHLHDTLYKLSQRMGRISDNPEISHGFLIDYIKVDDS